MTALHAIDSDSVSTGKPKAHSILLVGNPNCGKTTLFNALTGNRHKVANYPGVTVEKREGRLSTEADATVKVTDLPGIYSIAGQSADERVAEQELRSASSSDTIIVVVVDASNLDRNLYLVSELMDLDARLVLALNMTDVAQKDGIHIREVLLSQGLGIPVVSITARKRETIEPLTKLLLGCVDCPEKYHCDAKKFAWANNDESIIALSERDASSRSLEESGTIAAARYAWIKNVLERCVTRSEQERNRLSDRIDSFVLHPIFGSAFFVLLMALVFQAVFAWASYPMDLIDGTMGALGEYAHSLLPAGIFRSLVVDGIIAGVGAVVIFIPQIAILFFIIGLLEQSGYLCRAAVLMDKLMRQVGLQGRSFIPMLSSFACAIPGIMATRTIPSHSDRLITILVAPLMSCAARLPVYALLIAAFIPKSSVFGLLSLQGLVLFGLYLLGILGAALVAWIIKITMLRREPSVFAMELPRYKLPMLGAVLLEIFDRVMIFLKNAGTIILACSVVLWFLAAFPQSESGTPNVKESYAGQLGQFIEPVIEPLGYNWEIGVGLIASFAAREVFVSSLSTVYSLGDDDDAVASLSTHLQGRAEAGTGFGLATALSLLVFYVFACQCMSTLAICKRETGSWLWPTVMFVYMTALAYGSAWITFRIASAYL